VGTKGEGPLLGPPKVPWKKKSPPKCVGAQKNYFAVSAKWPLILQISPGLLGITPVSYINGKISQNP